MPTNVTNERQTDTHTAVKLALAYIARSTYVYAVDQSKSDQRKIYYYAKVRTYTYANVSVQDWCVPHTYIQ